MEKIFQPIGQRRLRTGSLVRELVADVHLSHRAFIQPLFVEEGIQEKRTVEGLPGIYVFPAEEIAGEVTACIAKGIHKFLLFPVPAKKTTDQFDFSFATAVVRHLKAEFGEDIWLASDLCLCSYTTHGHCGILDKDQTRLINHLTVEVLTRYALQLAQAGADCVAPSDMTDGRIGSIRAALNAMGKEEVMIMSYAAKFSSQWYGPFRDACHSGPGLLGFKGLKDRRTYQISPFNRKDAIATAIRDDAEGADIIMIKPATHYTDIIVRLADEVRKPIAAYHVSGEYAALESLVEKGLANRALAHLEIWTALTRAGASIIISYAAKEAKEWIKSQEY